MPHIRPFVPINAKDSFLTTVGKEINNHNLHAGKGLKVVKGSNGTTISLTDNSRLPFMNYRGIYNTASFYNPLDVVFVDPSITYYTFINASSSAISIPYETSASFARPTICAGLFVCVNFVPAQEQNYGLLTGSVIPSYRGTLQNIVADTFRHYQYNAYYPIYPLIPTASRGWVSGSYYTVANQTYWEPLTPYLPARFCYNNVETTMFLAGIISGSTFDNTKLPYTGSF